MSSLPQDVSSFLKVRYGEAIDNTELAESAPKRGTCRLCVLEKKRTSASMKCHRCGAFTCKKHSKIEISCNNCVYELEDS